MTNISQIQQTYLTPAVQDALREFATALGNTPQLEAFSACASTLYNDQGATEAIYAFQSKQQSLQMMFRLNAVSDDELKELERLQQAMYDNPVVSDYIQAQNAVIALCQASAALLSERIGLEFSVKRGGCCG